MAAGQCSCQLPGHAVTGFRVSHSLATLTNCSAPAHSGITVQQPSGVREPALLYHSVPKLQHTCVALHLCPGVLMTNKVNTAICRALIQGDKKCWLLSKEGLFSIVHVNRTAQ